MKLFEPFVSPKLTLANRVVMAPMTRAHSPGEVPNEENAAYYARRAAAQVGLIVSEGTLVDRPEAGDTPGVPYFAGEAALAGWKRTIDAVHAAGGKMFPQLWHVGMTRKPEAQLNPGVAPLGPSGLNAEGAQISAPMTVAEIDAVIAAFGQAASDAQRLGFDGIELHGAHGYLIDQFFWEQTNRRTDSFGGGIVQRTRFASEIIRACRARTSEIFPITLRFSQWKIGHYDAQLARTPQELEQFLAPLTEAGVDIFHCSQRRYWEPAFDGSALNLAGWTKKLTGKPVITVGAVGLGGDFIQTFGQGGALPAADLAPVERMLEAGETDLVAVGRALLADPTWAAKTHSNAAPEAFHSDALKRYY